ncbi:MAG: hypothetical protein ABUR63_02675, partial [Verrucomicrobiota bacterium]
MPAKEPPAPDLVSELAALLSGGAGHDVAAVTPDAPARLTLRQLQDAAKKLGLSAVSKLKKEALAKAVMDGWEALVAGAPSTQPDESQAFVLPQKFEVGESTRGGSEAARQILREASKDIPWGYGRDRVTAMVVDPDRLFIYWETLDESIAKARDQLGLWG